MRVILALAFLLAAEASGQFVSYPAASGAGSVVTNGFTNEHQHVTNSSFASGIGGWSDQSPNGVVFSHFSNAFVQALKLENINENQGAILAHAFTPVSSSKTGLLTFAYWFTNSDDRNVKGRIWNHVDDVDTLFGIPNNGAGVTSVIQRYYVNQYFNGTDIWLEVAGGPGGTDGSIFLDFISVTSAWDGVSVTTNSGGSSGGSSISIGGSKVGVTHR